MNASTPRLPAHKTPAIEALIYRTLVRPALRRTFHRIAIGGEEPQPSPLSTVFYVNHPSWWDGYLAFFLSYERWRRDGYLMMEEPQLARYSFFRYCGVFSVDRHDPREAMRSVRYSADLLRQRPGRLVWIFPQGDITPNDQRPLQLFSGAAHIARRAAPVRCIPVAFRFEFLTEQRPEALVRLGAEHSVEGSIDVRRLHHEMEARLTAEADRLRNDVITGRTETYTTGLHGRESVNVRWDKIRSRIKLWRSTTRFR